ncbi:MAG: DUF2190 family protein [Rhodocyclaceae bacterium]|nr:DUF2190 family protein [Rhodocyclaceae bacterium]
MSQQSIALLNLTLAATGAIVANRFVTPSGAQTGADGVAIGVAGTAASAGEKFPVVAQGTAVVEAGAAVAAGATLKVDASGRAITWATSGAKVGFALEAAGAAGQMIEVLLLDNA